MTCDVTPRPAPHPWPGDYGTGLFYSCLKHLIDKYNMIYVRQPHCQRGQTVRGWPGTEKRWVGRAWGEGVYY